MYSEIERLEIGFENGEIVSVYRDAIHRLCFTTGGEEFLFDNERKLLLSETMLLKFKIVLDLSNESNYSLVDYGNGVPDKDEFRRYAINRILESQDITHLIVYQNMDSEGNREATSYNVPMNPVIQNMADGSHTFKNLWQKINFLQPKETDPVKKTYAVISITPENQTYGTMELNGQKCS